MKAYLCLLSAVLASVALSASADRNEDWRRPDRGDRWDRGDRRWSEREDVRAVRLGFAELDETRWGEEDRDYVNVNNNVPITRVKLRVGFDGAVIKKLKIKFCSDRAEPQVIDFGRGLVLGIGESSRWFDLPGVVRCIDSFVVVGHSSRRPSESLVALIGDKADIVHIASTELHRGFERDQINNRDIGGIRALQLVVERQGSVTLDYLKVVFCSPFMPDQVIDLNGVTLEGDRRRQTGWFDLAGGERCIRKLKLVGGSNGRHESTVTIRGLNY